MEKKQKFGNLIIGCITILFFTSCSPDKPNIILIMADDMGYECLSSNGSTSYETPVLDKLGNNGIRFTNCYSQPLCTPSRVKIMTGEPNYENYEYFGYLNPSQRTFGNVVKEAGYATCIVGKWQLNGINHQNEGFEDNTRPQHFGFDEHCLWQLTKARKEGERYANPKIERNGEVLKVENGDYGPDIFADYLIDFVSRNQNNPFFAYYPMVLVHDPFTIAPGHELWQIDSLRYQHDTTYFKEMVAYTDKIIGQIVNTLDSLKILDNTILIFTGDNGTHPSIYSNTNEGRIRGAKGNTIQAGIHVPMIAHWPDGIKNKGVVDALIDFSDYYPTISDIVGAEKEDFFGKSFFNLLRGDTFDEKEAIMIHYDPEWGRNNKFKSRFAMTKEYKLYQNGQFYNFRLDPLEKLVMNKERCTEQELEIRKKLQNKLDQAPDWQ
ncbi:MAG: sulfatase-like hydrolase/transferase [Bacteroidetes bacterium]|nr:sulfatase-like hydrolase/transferase [Bacteroidota bacterium]